MTARIVSSLALILLCTASAHAQERLTRGLADRIGKGIDKLTEEEALKLVPGAVTVSFGEEALGNDCVLTWKEVRGIRVEFLGDKASAVSGTFSDLIESTTLTLANLKKIAKGMKQQDVEKLLEGSGSFRGGAGKNFEGKDIRICEWEDGRVLQAFIKNGKVSGYRFVNSVQ
jgi:hypothetical protein